MDILLIGVICLMSALTGWALWLARQQRLDSLHDALGGELKLDGDALAPDGLGPWAFQGRRMR